MCKLVTFTVDRKTWKEIAVKVEDSDETIDYQALADFYTERYLEHVRKEQSYDRV